MERSREKIRTHDVCLVLDLMGEEEREASALKVGSAWMSGNDFFVELVPGVAVSGKIVFRLREAHHRQGSASDD
jgi:hypothetical protein